MFNYMYMPQCLSMHPKSTISMKGNKPQVVDYN